MNRFSLKNKMPPAQAVRSPWGDQGAWKRAVGPGHKAPSHLVFPSSFFALSLYLLLWSLVQLWTLMDFPYVHSDEVWLIQIANTMLQRRSFCIKEPFFDLYPRTIHPFRWAYNLLLLPFLLLAGPKVFCIRLLSLLGGVLCLFVFHRLLKKLGYSAFLRFFPVVALSLNIQFIYGAHLGRQETWILFFLLLEVLLILSSAKPWILAAVLLVAGGIHPNSFLIGVVAFFLLLWDCHRGKAHAHRRFFLVMGYLFLGGGIYFLAGLVMNPSFLQEYLAFGASFGTDAAARPRLQGFFWYFFKLYHQIGGTYVLMDIRLYLLMGALNLLLWFPIFVLSLGKKGLKAGSAYAHSPDAQGGHTAFLCLIALVFGFFILGRYNQTTVVFLMPFLLLLCFQLLALATRCLENSSLLFPALALRIDGIRSFIKNFLSSHFSVNPIPRTPLAASSFQKGAFGILMGLLVIVSAQNTAHNLRAYHRQHFYAVSYQEMLHRVRRLLPPDAVVLANLNTVEALEPGRFYDFRNLGLLANAGISIQEYLQSRHVTHVILPQEMDYLYETRPRWEFLYGDMSYYPALKQFLQDHALCVDVFENPTYAMRLSRYSGTYPWTTAVYKLRK